jgi:hypothetical protein
MTIDGRKLFDWTDAGKIAAEEIGAVIKSDVAHGGLVHA